MSKTSNPGTNALEPEQALEESQRVPNNCEIMQREIERYWKESMGISGTFEIIARHLEIVLKSPKES